MRQRTCRNILLFFILLRPNRLYILFPDEKVGQKSDAGNSTGVGWKTGPNPVGNLSPNKYINNKTNNSLRDYDYEEEESF